MEYKGKKIKGLEIYDETDNDRVIAKICDDKMETTNGFKVRVIPYVEEVCTNQ